MGDLSVVAPLTSTAPIFSLTMSFFLLRRMGAHHAHHHHRHGLHGLRRRPHRLAHPLRKRNVEEVIENVVAASPWGCPTGPCACPRVFFLIGAYLTRRGGSRTAPTHTKKREPFHSGQACPQKSSFRRMPESRTDEFPVRLDPGIRRNDGNLRFRDRSGSLSLGLPHKPLCPSASNTPAEDNHGGQDNPDELFLRKSRTSGSTSISAPTKTLIPRAMREKHRPIDKISATMTQAHLGGEGARARRSPLVPPPLRE